MSKRPTRVDASRNDLERPASPHIDATIGTLLKRWRGVRHLSQLQLAADAAVSARHLSFVESGRAKPSRDMVVRIAEAMDLPIRARNELLMAAGYAPLFRETALDELPADGIPAVLQRLLEQQEPYPALIADRSWNIITCNAALIRMSRALVDPESYRAAGRASRNVMKHVFDPRLMRPAVLNWEEVAREIMLRLHHEASEAAMGEPSARLLEELRQYPGVPDYLDVRSGYGGHPGVAANSPAMTVSMRRGDVAINYVSMLTTFGTPQDVTLQELRIKLYYPADAATADTFRALAEPKQQP
jgi:transcriptional regulator with XRE-family HTH domain